MKSNKSHRLLVDPALVSIAELSTAGNDVIDAGRERRFGGNEKAQRPCFLDCAHARGVGSWSNVREAMS